MKLISENGLIVLQYNAKQVNIVADGNAELEILIDGNQVSEKIAGSDIELSKIRIVEPRLYNIINSDHTGIHELKIVENYVLQESEDFVAEEDENTLSFLNRYIDDSDFECDKNIIKGILQKLYAEACEVD